MEVRGARRVGGVCGAAYPVALLAERCNLSPSASCATSTGGGGVERVRAVASCGSGGAQTTGRPIMSRPIMSRPTSSLESLCSSGNSRSSAPDWRLEGGELARGELERGKLDRGRSSPWGRAL